MAKTTITTCDLCGKEIPSNHERNKVELKGVIFRGKGKGPEGGGTKSARRRVMLTPDTHGAEDICGQCITQAVNDHFQFPA